MITYREAISQDSERLKALLKELGLFDPDLVFEKVHLAVDGDQLVGLAHLRQAGSALELTHVGVLPAYRGQGVARGLIGTLLKDLRKDVYLNTIDPGFFEKLGFVRTDEFPAQYNKPAGWCRGCSPEKCVSLVKKIKEQQ